ncbi:MAG: hypothetical protein CMI52_00725 [Parcubacteria group bacterium]|nr:hypothetical protein [Parcubacteria group bacterium]
MQNSTASRYRGGRKGGYNNPFFPKKQPTRKAKKSPIKYVVFFLLCVGIVVAASEYPGFHITQVNINGAQLIDESKVGETAQSFLNKRTWFIQNKSSILLSKKNLKQELQNTLPVTDVEINRDGLNTITITIGERLPVFRLNYPPDHFSVIDEDGIVVFAEIGTTLEVPDVMEEEEEKNNSETVSDDTTTEEPPTTSVVECIFCDTFTNLTLITASSTPPSFWKSGTSTLPKSTVSSLLTIKDRFNSLAIPVKHFTITEKSPETAEIRVQEGFLVYIDLSKDINAQIENLGALLDREYPTAPRNVRYIDVRYGNRLYYQ